MLLAFAALLAAPTQLGADPATWGPSEVNAQELLGADSATWAPSKPMKQELLGADSATWAPSQAAASGCDSLKDKPTCDKAKCSWCLSGAVPPACKTLDEAKQLPSAVFQCDNI